MCGRGGWQHFSPGCALGIGIQFEWRAVSARSGFEGIKAGPYTLVARNQAGCTQSANILLEAATALTLDLPADTTIIPGQSVLLEPTTSGPVALYAWMPPDYLDCSTCTAPLATPLETTTYTLVVYNASGCSATDRTTVRVTGPAVYVPNVFDPGSPGLNNVFGIWAARGVRQVLYLEIYDRWGGLVFRRERFAADGLTGWDGRWKGRDCSPGVYVYTLELEMDDGNRIRIAGDVALVR
ncbi:MAG: gliding motility-associated C-terminal domain-containing protein [Saprospirales bacterium]|nr:gliding motility-associated C-terminal domain-containing protein [Saprospirales bacterium]